MKPPILYSFRRCPYAMRARMAIAYAGVSVELREVVLRNVPAAMKLISPKATVPVLQLQEGEVIDESFDIMRWALRQNDPDGWVDPRTLSACEALIRENDDDFKSHLDHYKYADRFPQYSAEKYRGDAQAFLNKLEQKLAQAPYLFGDKISFADIAIFPFIRQFSMVDKKWFDEAPFPCLQAWLDAFLNSDLFVSIMNKYPAWCEGDLAVQFPPNTHT